MLCPAIAESRRLVVVWACRSSGSALQLILMSPAEFRHAQVTSEPTNPGGIHNAGGTMTWSPPLITESKDCRYNVAHGPKQHVKNISTTTLSEVSSEYAHLLLIRVECKLLCQVTLLDPSQSWLTTATQHYKDHRAARPQSMILGIYGRAPIYRL